MANVLVLGGAGYIGSHCCKALAQAGIVPVVYDNLSTGHRAFVRFGPLIEGDIRDKAKLTMALLETKPVAVMHFAALALVSESTIDPGAYYDTNVVGTLRLLQAMRDTSPSNLILSSSCAVYGEPSTLLIAEDQPCRPVNPYGATKLTCERMMDDFDRAHGIRSIRLRYFNSAGADADCEIGERHDPETHLIPLVFDAALRRRPHVKVFGADYPTPDGSPIRDYIHVADLALAHLASLDFLLGGGMTQAVNLGTGKGVSVLEVIAIVERVTQRSVPMEVAPRRAGDPDRLVADPRLARTVLHWEARHTKLEEIIADAWEWHRR